jgi:hypothetical protein
MSCQEEAIDKLMGPSGTTKKETKKDDGIDGQIVAAGGLRTEDVERAHAELSGAQVLKTAPVNAGSSAFGVSFGGFRV